MKKIRVTVISVHAGPNDDLSKESHDSITAELDGFVGDRHKTFTHEGPGAYRRTVR